MIDIYVCVYVCESMQLHNLSECSILGTFTHGKSEAATCYWVFSIYHSACH